MLVRCYVQRCQDEESMTKRKDRQVRVTGKEALFAGFGGAEGEPA